MDIKIKYVFHLVKLFKCFIITIISFSFSGCGASFSKNDFRKDFKKINNIELISGEYDISPKKIYPWYKSSSYLRSVNIFNLIDNRSSKGVNLNLLDRIEITNNKSDQKVDIEVINLKTIRVRFLIDKKVRASRDIQGELKKGFFYLDNKYKKTNGIPFLWGGKNTSKCRIGLAKNNDLIINIAAFNGGALLFFLASGTGSHNSSYKIERLKK